MGVARTRRGPFIRLSANTPPTGMSRSLDAAANSPPARAIINIPPQKDKRGDPLGILMEHRHAYSISNHTQRGSVQHYHIGLLDGDGL